MADTRPVVVVTGDATIDWNIARADGTRRILESSGVRRLSLDEHVRACSQRGGAMLLADLMEAIARRSSRAAGSRFEVRTIAGPSEPVHPDDHRFHHSYATFTRFARDPKSPDAEPAWRVDESLGLDRRASDGGGLDEWQPVMDDAADAAVVVLDDAGLGFRAHRDSWPQAVTDPARTPWVLLKMAQGPAQGALWDDLYRSRAGRLVVVLTIADLRRADVQVSRELSWERTAQDLAWELTHNPEVSALSRCSHVVVSFGPAGALLLTRSRSRGRSPETYPRCTLFFDPEVIEGMWEHEHPGGMIGYTTTLTAAIARQLIRSPARPNLALGVQSGLAAMRTLHREGFGDPGVTEAQTRLAFPTDAVAGAIVAARRHFVAVPVPDPDPSASPGSPGVTDPASARRGFWTILSDSYADNLDGLAEQIVREGPEVALRNVPLGRFGDLLTVDREQIEGLRSIRRLVAEYCGHSEKIPLSVAVFGAPGSGKTYGILQMAEAVRPGLIESVDFNLSQFSSPGDLVDALHVVRDVALAGKIPLVLWDEFDTALADQRLGWLRYFLAPMEDGKFQEGQLVHPIGRSIFVFVGGTSSRMDEFVTQKGHDGQERMTQAEFVSVKGPDFVSRLRGYLNVRGPNRETALGAEPGSADPYFVIRRAILLHSILAHKAKPLLGAGSGGRTLNIDPGVLYAFLHTKEYRHGIRSMSSIVSMSRLSDLTSFERSCLPDEAQLDLHVNGREFLEMVHRTELTGAALERLAKAVHEVFCASLRDKGFTHGPRNDEKRKTSSALRPFDELPEDEKEQNRGNARDISRKLAQIGYLMVPRQGSDDHVPLSADEVEALARREHERWVQAKLDAGWGGGRRTDKAGKVHEALVPWDQLPESQKDKDRDLVVGIPEILATAGYTIVPARSQTVRR